MILVIISNQLQYIRLNPVEASVQAVGLLATMVTI